MFGERRGRWGCRAAGEHGRAAGVPGAPPQPRELHRCCDAQVAGRYDGSGRWAEPLPRREGVVGAVGSWEKHHPLPPDSALHR